MNEIISISLLLNALQESKTSTGIPIQVEMIDGELPVLQVLVQDREEFPIYITIDDCQILCVSHLWQECEVRTEKREEMLESLLVLSIPMPLSSFSKVGLQYIIFGALSIRSTIAEVLHEIETLSDNTLDAVAVMADYLH